MTTICDTVLKKGKTRKKKKTLRIFLFDFVRFIIF